ncbi:MAG: hypothetical protein A3J83_06570 [Elusimicrobia bacterium RIFOXYA2_FULL_40_6]|nr:MAG: hypothetical protein A3J83_06570 [Elusimicrobia bacterium RIFOXYA2_FULL_40_6]
MFKKFVFAVMVSVLFISQVMAQVPPAPVAQTGLVATIKLVTGSVKVQPNGQKVKFAAKESMLLSVGDSVETSGKSFAILIMSNGAQIKINQNTKFVIESPVGNEEPGMRVKVAVGQIWAKIISGKQFYVKTPTAVCSIRGTELDVKVNESGESEVLVFEGVVEVKNDYGVVQVNKEEKTVSKPSVAPQAPVVVDVTKVEKWQDAVVAKEEKKEEPKVEKKEEKKKEEVKKEEPKKEEIKPEESKQEEIPQEVRPEPIQPPTSEASPSVPE